MQINQSSDLVTYILSEEEVNLGHLLTHYNVGVIQNRRVEIVQQLASLTPSTMSAEGKETYWQQEAYLRGQLDILSHLIAAHNAVYEASQSQQN